MTTDENSHPEVEVEEPTESHEVPPDLVELFEVLEWNAALEGADR